MSLAVQPKVVAGQSVLEGCAEKLNVPLEGCKATVKVLAERILVEGSASQLLIDSNLAKRATALQETVVSPVNALAIKALVREIKDEKKNKINIHNSSTARDFPLKACEKVCREMLLDVPSRRMPFFIATVEFFYHKALSEGLVAKEALEFALAKGTLRSMVNLPTNEEIDGDMDLKVKIEGELSLEPYRDAVMGHLIRSDPLYWNEKTGIPYQRYDQMTVNGLMDITVDGISGKADPFKAMPVVPLEAIKIDLVGREFVENKLLDLIYPELEVGSLIPLEIKALQSKSVLLAVATAYPLVQKEYSRVLEKSKDTHLAIKVSESYARDLMSRFILLVEGTISNVLDEEGQKLIPPFCFSYIEEFIKQSADLLSVVENLEEVKVELVGRFNSFIICFHEIESIQMPLSSKKQALKIAGDEIGKGASLDQVRRMIEEYKTEVDAIAKQEERLRCDFPGFLLGKEEWDRCLGEVSQVPVPAGIRDVANSPCPITSDKKIWETHMLVLIPDLVNGQPFTLNRLGELIKRKGCFFSKLNKEVGYDYMGPSVVAEHGNKPAGSPRFVLMTRDVLPESRHKSYIEQVVMVEALSKVSGATYEVPKALQAATCIYMNYLISGIRLYGDSPWTYTRSQDESEGHSVIVGGFVSKGLRVVNHVGDNRCNGIAALRML